MLEEKKEEKSQYYEVKLTLFFGTFTLLAALLLAFVSTFRLNHGLHSFFGFLRLLKGPHVGGAPSPAGLLRLPCGEELRKVQ